MSLQDAKIGCLLGRVCCLLLLAGCHRAPEVGPAARIRTGWARYAEGDLDLAAVEFEGALSGLPAPGPLRAQALHGLAVTWDLRRPGQDPDRAAQLYRAAMAAAPTNDLAGWCALALARMQATQAAVSEPDVQSLRRVYQQVIDQFPAHPAAEEAFLFQQAARLAQPDAAESRAVLAALEDFLRTHPQSPQSAAAYRLVAHCAEVLGLPDKRLEATLAEWHAGEVDPLNSAQDLSWVYWRIATLAEFETGDFVLAREYYRKLIAEYPTEQRVFLAKQELQRMDDLERQLAGGAGR